MKRGISSSSAGRSSGRNGARPEQDEGQDGAPTSNEASKKSGAAAGDAAAAEGRNGEAAAAAAQGERTNYLVGMAGHRTLTSYVQDLSKGRRWSDRVRGWGEEAGLAEPSVKLALGFLDILGVSSGGSAAVF